MAKDNRKFIFYLDIPMQRRHEIAWLLAKNNFKVQKDIPDKFYDGKNTIYLKKIYGLTDYSYDFSIHLVEEDLIKETHKIKGHDGLEKFIQNLAKNRDFLQTE